MRASAVSNPSSSASIWSIIRKARSTVPRATVGSSTLASHARPSAVSSPERSGSPWWNSTAWMRWCQPVRAPISARRSRTWVRASAMWAGGGHDWGRVPAQQLPQVAGVGPVGLGAPLGAAQRVGVGRLGQVRADPNAGELLGDEPPAGRGLQREAGLLLVELVEPGVAGRAVWRSFGMNAWASFGNG
jgi:hypothetical protein